VAELPLRIGAASAMACCCGSRVHGDENEFAVAQQLRPGCNRNVCARAPLVPAVRSDHEGSSGARSDSRLQGESFLSAEQQALVVDVALSWRCAMRPCSCARAPGMSGWLRPRLADTLRGELKCALRAAALARIVGAERADCPQPY